jgi:hypothetical protein
MVDPDPASKEYGGKDATASAVKRLVRESHELTVKVTVISLSSSFPSAFSQGWRGYCSWRQVSIATGYDKKAENFIAALCLADIACYWI